MPEQSVPSVSGRTAAGILLLALFAKTRRAGGAALRFSHPLRLLVWLGVRVRCVAVGACVRCLVGAASSTSVLRACVGATGLFKEGAHGKICVLRTTCMATPPLMGTTSQLQVSKIS